MRTQMNSPVRQLACAAAIALAPTLVAAQLPNASAAAFGMAGNFTAIARGYEAISWNPANLAMPGRPFFSIGLAIAGGNAGLDPIDITALNKFSGIEVDSATKAGWIDQARLAGGQRLNLDGGVTPFAMSVGPVGVQLGATAYSSTNLSADAFEAMLFGNAGNNGGQPKSIDMTGTRLRAGLISSGAVSVALPLPLTFTGNAFADERIAIGVTGKYIVGNGLFIAEDLGSNIGTDDLLLRFPIIGVDSSWDGRVGTGQAADISVAWSAGPWKVGVLAENVFNTFKWDTTKLVYMPGTGSVSFSGSSTDFDQQPLSAAPQELRAIISAHTFKPALRVGAAWDLMKSLTLTADMRTQTGTGDAITIGPKSHYGVGAEWRVLPFIPLRAGVASVTDGWQAGAGAGIRFLGYELGVATSIRRRGVATESGLMVGVVGIGR